MIQANELRIGNWVLDSDRDNPYFHQVVRIETKEYTEWNSGDELNVVCLLEGTKDSYFEMIPSPIQLTEEWLVRFGFEKTYESEYRIRYDHKERAEFGFDIPKILDISEEGFRFYGRYIKIQYVHQLQNLYFTLTGQELKLKDK